MPSRVWLAQMKCPDNHCILAASAEVEDRAEAEEFLSAPLQAAVDNALNEKVLNPWCGLCGAAADTWKIDLQPTAFASMDEAMPVLKEVEAANHRAIELFGDLHRKQRPN